MELVLTVLLATILRVGAQSTDVATCVDGHGWVLNSMHQNPCLVAAYLLQECSVIAVDIPVQTSGNRYPEPGDPGFPPNQCSCSSVGYSILAACSFCQNLTYPTWSSYSAACKGNVSFTWTEGIPALTAIPAWAFDNPIAEDGWDPVLANQVALGGKPDVTANSTTTTAPTTATTANTPTATEPIESSPTPSTDTTPNGDNVSSSHKPVGAIVGGVVGGLAALGVGAIGVALVLRYTRSKGGPQLVRPSGSRWPSSNSMISRWVKSGGQQAYSPGIQPFDQSQTTTYVAPQPTSSGMNTISSSRVLGYNQHVAEV